MSNYTPEQVARMYPELATRRVSSRRIAEALGVTRHTVRAAAAIARESAAYMKGLRDGLDTQSPDPVDILVIPDAHTMPGESLRRFTWLGQYARKCALRAERRGREFILLSIGDFCDVHSLSSWDKGKASGENARYHLDIAANKRALELIDQGLGDYAKTVRKVITLGNHENRVNRFANDNPAMSGYLDAGVDLGFAEHGWEVVPFLKPKRINGVTFVHYVPNKMGRAMGGVTLTRRLVQTCHASVVVGHSHSFSHWKECEPLEGRVLHGVQVGCFFEADHDFAGPMGNHQYDKGLVLLENVRNGDFDVTTISMESLQERYGP